MRRFVMSLNRRFHSRYDPWGNFAGTVDFDWLMDAGPFGGKRSFGIDVFPAFQSYGEGPIDNPTLVTTTSVRILNRFQ